jgi:hypothetical protein
MPASTVVGSFVRAGTFGDAERRPGALLRLDEVGHHPVEGGEGRHDAPCLRHVIRRLIVRADRLATP